MHPWAVVGSGRAHSVLCMWCGPRCLPMVAVLVGPAAVRSPFCCPPCSGLCISPRRQQCRPIGWSATAFVLWLSLLPGRRQVCVYSGVLVREFEAAGEAGCLGASVSEGGLAVGRQSAIRVFGVMRNTAAQCLRWLRWCGCGGVFGGCASRVGVGVHCFGTPAAVVFCAATHSACMLLGECQDERTGWALSGACFSWSRDWLVLCAKQGTKLAESPAALRLRKGWEQCHGGAHRL